MFENPRGGRQARNFTADVPKILDLKSSSEQIFSKNRRWVPLLEVYFSFGFQGQEFLIPQANVSQIPDFLIWDDNI